MISGSLSLDPFGMKGLSFTEIYLTNGASELGAAGKS